MKLTIFLILFAVFGAYADTHAQKISLNVKSTSLKTTMVEITRQTGFTFVFEENVDLNRLVSVQVKDSELEEVLKLVFDPQKLSYKIKGKSVSLSMTHHLNDSLNGLAQDIIKGRVLNEHGKAVSGATVRLVGTNLATSTDVLGNFSFFITQQTNIPSQVEISFLGYSTLRLKFQFEMGDIILEPFNYALKEVNVNAGYYTVADRDRTGNISRVDGETIKNQPILNPLAALIGRMPGVNVTQTTGVPGGGFTVEIRGRNTLSTLGNPLYIVDGVPFSSDGMGNNQVGGTILGISQAVTGVPTFGLSPLAGINPSDIQSIEVLKDADATAIYGSRGANGVVLITTRRPSSERTDFNIRYSKGAGKVPMNLELLETKAYLEMRREAYLNDGVSVIPASAYDINGTWDTERYTDWQKELVGGTATQENIQASVSGGNKNTQFTVGGGYLRENSVFPGDFYNGKLSGRSVLTHKSENERFDLMVTLGYTVDKNDFPGSDLNYYAVSLSPNAPALYNIDGSLNWENGTWSNPLAHTEQNYISKYDNLLMNSVLSYRLWKGLQVKTSLGLNQIKMNESRTVPNTFYNPAFGIGPEQSSIFFSNTNRKSWILEPQLIYDWKEDANLKINALIGMTLQENSNSILAQYASGFSSNNLIYDVRSAANVNIMESSAVDYRYGAMFGRVNINWKSKLSVNLTGRRDGSSRFGPGRQFANFGALGMGWIFSEEDWVKDQLAFLSFGKLRGSFGITGSDNIGDYKYLDTYSTTANLYQNIKGLTPTGLFNPNFAWESNQKREAALELGFFGNKLQFNTAFYHNISSNQLVGIPLSGVTGFKSIQANLDATVLNTGWEFELSSTNLRTSKFSWNTSINLTIPHNELLSFPGLANSTYADRYVVGQPLNIVKVYNFLGVNPETGLYKFEDLNGDGVLNALDRQYIGRIYQQYFGGIQNTFTVGKFNLDVFFQFAKQNGRNYLYGAAMPGIMNNQFVEVLKRWKQPGDQTHIQRYSSSNDGYLAFRNLSTSTAAFTDASFIRLKNVMASYDLDGEFMGKTKARVFVQGQNLLTFTRFNGLDPETNSTANSSIPALRMITLGFDFNF